MLSYTITLLMTMVAAVSQDWSSSETIEKFARTENGEASLFHKIKFAAMLQWT